MESVGSGSVKIGRVAQAAVRRCAARGPVKRVWRFRRSHRKCIVFVIVCPPSSRLGAGSGTGAEKRKGPGAMPPGPFDLDDEAD
jgi:hypothetical protein